MRESDLHVRISKENADYFAEYVWFEIDEAITVRISAQIRVFCVRNFYVVKSGKIRQKSVFGHLSCSELVHQNLQYLPNLLT